jgi:heterodisulfide reductase subunit A
MAIDADYLVLSTGLRPQPDGDEFAKKFKLTCNIDGFLLEAHVKLRPVDFPSEGFFLAGLAHAPKNLEETISQSLAAAGRVGALLSNDSLTVSGVISKHNRDICMSCLACVKKCPFGAPFIDVDGRVSHNEVKCTGCGICAGVCPAKAYQVNYFRDDQLLAMIDSVTAGT